MKNLVLVLVSWLFVGSHLSLAQHPDSYDPPPQDTDSQNSETTVRVLTTSGNRVEVSIPELRSAFMRSYKKGAGLVEASSTRPLVQNVFELTGLTFRIDESGTKRPIAISGLDPGDALCLSLGYKQGTGLEFYTNSAGDELAEVDATAESSWTTRTRPWKVELLQLTEKPNRDVLKKVYCRL